jgi:hypothetical protein
MTDVLTKYRLHAISPDVLEEVRRSGRDVSGNEIVSTVADGGEPLRCCLRNAVAGEDLILFGFEPKLPASPYREIGPVFAHAHACDGPRDGYPAEWLGKAQVLRAYDRRGWIHPATCVHDGSDPATAIDAVLADPDVVLIHSRNVAYGCYMFAVTRS